MTEDEERVQQCQHLPPTTVSPCSQGGSGANGHAPPHLHDDDEWYSTHPHAYEPLLVGWIVGADGNDNRAGDHGKMAR